MASGVWGGMEFTYPELCYCLSVNALNLANPSHHSATMDLAYTAMGSVDIWWEGGCWEWSARPVQTRLCKTNMLTVSQGRCSRYSHTRRGWWSSDDREPTPRSGNGRDPTRETGWEVISCSPVSSLKLIPCPAIQMLILHSPAGDTQSETGRQSQERVVREVWKRVQVLDYSRPGA